MFSFCNAVAGLFEYNQITNLLFKLIGFSTQKLLCCACKCVGGPSRVRKQRQGLLSTTTPNQATKARPLECPPRGTYTTNSESFHVRAAETQSDKCGSGDL